jgi:peptidoglycan-associated lipoprotein
MTRTKILLLFTCAASQLVACSSTPPAPPASMSAPAAPMAPATATAAAPPPAAPRPVPASTPALPAHLDPRSAISLERSVYFDFDEFAVKPEYTALIERHGKYLAASPSLAIKIEGNTDERGGAEYNLALGQKRAEAVLRALRIYGVKPSQMEAVSWGKERPKSSGHDEAAWALNRRADLQYPRQ